MSSRDHEPSGNGAVRGEAEPDRVRELGAVLYYARIKEAWGIHWPHRDKWPKDEAAWRALPHHPCAEVELILIQARAALSWMGEPHPRANSGTAERQPNPREAK